MIPEFRYMTDQGLVLTGEGEDLLYEYQRRADFYGCSCHICPPCNTCTHPGHPESLVNTPEYWESDLEAGIRAAIKGTLQ